MFSEFADRYGMLPRGGTVLCAVSGGADSMCLLHAMCRLGEERGFAVACAHYEHGLRGEASRRDARFVEDWCRAQDIPFYCEHGDTAARAAEYGESVETAARALRYAFLYRTADRIGALRIATAHTADDNAETLLLRLARGTGTRGLGGIPPVRGRLIRPMLLTDRQQVETYLRENGVPWTEDESNAGDDYARNRIRHYAMPALHTVSPRAAASASRAALLLREDEAFLQSLADKALTDFCPERGLSAELLTSLPGPVAVRVLRTLRPGLTAEHTETLLALSRGERGAAADVPGGRVRLTGGRLFFTAPAPAEPIPPRQVFPGAELPLPDGTHVLRCRQGTGNIYRKFQTLCFDYTKFCGKIYLTSRREGDSVRLAGRGCTKTLKKLLNEAHVPPEARDAVPVLRDEQGVVGVWGFGPAERCAGTENGPVWIVEITEEQDNAT